MKFADIHTSLKKLGLKKNDTVLIHGDAIVAAQFEIMKYEKNPVNFFLNSLIEYFHPHGTIVFPSFTYCMSSKNIFDKKKTNSKIGILSETFRKKKGVERSNHPIFSVCAIGKKSKTLTNYNLKDCFGKKSFFDIFTKLNGKVLCLGCSLEEGGTYFHYIEQKCKVKYRYMKKFSCAFVKNTTVKNLNINYYVRDLKKKNELNFKYLNKEVKKIIKISKIGRIKIQSYNAKKMLKKTSTLIKKYPNILVGIK